jgi:subtilisin family serine protease
MTRLATALLVVVALLVAGRSGAGEDGTAASVDRTQVLVTLEGRPAAYATLRASAVRGLRASQRAFEKRLRAAVPSAIVRRRYVLVANGLAIVLPREQLPRLRGLAGVEEVVPAVTYDTARTTDARAIERVAATALPGTDGEGIKIGIIDDGVDQSHPFFDPAGYAMPAGYPKGNRAFTTAKVIVARAFPPVGATYAAARLPFDAKASFHGTHVAGIAAGNAGTPGNGRMLSGAAPRALLGNYKALGIPTDAGVGLDGNAPELLAAIEAAVADGMDVINLSLGEPEIEPDEDVVARALDAAAAAGVAPVVAAGNDFVDFGAGSLSSPGSAQDAITVAAVDNGQPPAVASFSGSGPTPLSLRLKPDVAAPGVGVLSSVPGGWNALSGTSMAAPRVSGTLALLIERHPDWTVADLKAAVIGTASPARDDGRPARPVRAGGGVVDAVAADDPIVLADPASLSFGLLPDGATQTVRVALREIGGGAGTWNVTVEQASPATPLVAAPGSVDVPGELVLDVAVPTDAVDGDLTGTIVLRGAGVVRRIPFWGRLATSALAEATATPLNRPGVFKGNTAKRPARVTIYRYPEVPAGGAVNNRLGGPEQLFRIVVTREVANVGVVVLSRGEGVTVEPRVVEAVDENRLTGYAALPFNLNPYLRGFGEAVPAAGALQPAPGRYTVVFDSPTPAGAGPFTFRFWVDDRTPPSARVPIRSVPRSTPILARVSDAGSGVDPGSIVARVDGRPVASRLRGTTIAIDTSTVTRGRHRLRLQVSDYQETRNMENVARILPNTRVLTVPIVIR